VDVTITTPLAIGDILTATQTVNGLVSPESDPKLVVDVAPSVVTYRADFEVDPTAQWVVNGGPSDASADFHFDYSSVGIPQAPNSQSSGTHGLKLQANLTSNIFGGMSVSPVGKSFTGDYTLAFDWWGNFNGPFPGGGNGSTNLTTFGIMTAGTTAQWPGTADSIYFGATADGGSSADYRAYSPVAVASYQDGDPQYAAPSRNNSHAYYSVFGGVSAPAEQVALFPNQTGTTAIGAPGMTWNEVTITKSGPIVAWRINGLLISSIDTTGMSLGGDNILFGYSDINTTSSTDGNAPAMLFGLIDNVRILVAQPDSAGPNDWDGDGDVDLDDYEEMAGCLFGPGVPPDRADGCINTCLSTFDADGDSDIDLSDFAAFARGFNP
jgi:hypothetical protein